MNSEPSDGVALLGEGSFAEMSSAPPQSAASDVPHPNRVQIDGVGSSGLPPPIAPSGTASAQTQANKAALLLAIQQAEQNGGHGGGGGHAAHGVKKSALDSIDEIAARASLNIETRKKTVADRSAEIERLKAEMAESDDAGDDAGDDADREDDEREREA